MIRSGISDGDRNELVKQNVTHLVLNFMSALGSPADLGPESNSSAALGRKADAIQPGLVEIWNQSDSTWIERLLLPIPDVQTAFKGPI